MWWFVLGLSVAIALIGWKKSKHKQSEPEMLWSREYKQMYEDAVKDMEWLYQKR